MRHSLRQIVLWLSLSTLGGLPAAAQTVSCSGSLLSYVGNGDTGTTFTTCLGWGVCREPVPGSVSYSFVVAGCNPLSSTCSMRATLPVEFPGNHLNDPGAAGGAYSFAEVRLLSSAGALVGHCGRAGAVIDIDALTEAQVAGLARQDGYGPQRQRCSRDTSS